MYLEQVSIDQVSGNAISNATRSIVLRTFHPHTAHTYAWEGDRNQSEKQALFSAIFEYPKIFRLFMSNQKTARALRKFPRQIFAIGSLDELPCRKQSIIRDEKTDFQP